MTANSLSQTCSSNIPSQSDFSKIFIFNNMAKICSKTKGKYKTRKGFADPSGPDFEWKYACLLFLRALNTRGKFFLATNMEGVGKFDDIVLVYTEERRSKACFLQLKHKLNRQSVQRTALLDPSGDFSLPLLCQSFHQVLRHLPVICADLGVAIAEDDVSVALFTNARVEGVHGLRLRDSLLNAGGRVFAFTPESDPDVISHLENLAEYKAFLEQMADLAQNPEIKDAVLQLLEDYVAENRDTVFGRKVLRVQPNKLQESLQDLLREVRNLDKLDAISDFLKHLKIFHKQVNESCLIPLILAEFNVACGNPYHEKSVPFQHFMTGLKVWKNHKDELKKYLTRSNTLWKDTLVYSLSEKAVQDLGRLRVKFHDQALLSVSSAVAHHRVVLVLSDAVDCSLTLLKVHAALTLLGVRHVVLSGLALRARGAQVAAAWAAPHAAVLVVQLESAADEAEAVARSLRPPTGRLVLVRPAAPPGRAHQRPERPAAALPAASASTSAAACNDDKPQYIALYDDESAAKRRALCLTLPTPDLDTVTLLGTDGAAEDQARAQSARLVACQVVEDLVQSVTAVRKRRRDRSSVPRASSSERSRVESEDSDTDLEEKHERLVIKIQKQRRGPRVSPGPEKIQVEKTSHNEVLLRDTCTLKQLKRPAHILEKKIIFQGQPITLQHLLSVYSKFSVCLSGESLIHLFRDEDIIMGNPLGKVIDYYVPRVLHRNCRLSRSFLSTNEENTVFAFRGITLKDLEDIIPPGNKATQFSFTTEFKASNAKFVALSNDQVESALEYITAKASVEKFHLLHVDDSKILRWVTSKGDIKSLEPFIESDVDQFVPQDIDERVILITGKPGMGKSTLLSYVAKTLKERESNSWVIRINLSSHTNFLDKNESITLHRVAHLLRLAAMSEGRNNPFAQKYFNHCLKESGDIILLIDGFDEVCSRYTEKALQFLHVIQETKIKQIWLTSREISKDTLENYLSTLAFTLQGFDDKCQKTFLKAFWGRKLLEISRLDKFVDEFVKTVKASNLVSSRMQIPLETMMTAEAFQSQAEEYCLSSGSEVDLPTHMDLMDLYKTFVEMKYEIKIKKDGVDATKAGFNGLFNTLSKEYTENHKFLALAYLFSIEEIRQLLPSGTEEMTKALVITESVEADMEKVGIVTGVVNGLPQFIHRTFADYFAALWLAENCAANMSFLQEKLFRPDCRELRFMFDRLLARDCPLHQSVLLGDRRQLEALLQAGADPELADGAGRAALHLAAAYGRPELAEPLLGAGARLDRSDRLFAWRPLQYAEHTEAWAAAESLLEAGADPADLHAIHGKIRQPSFLAACARGGHIKLLQYVFDSKMATAATAIGVSRCTPLHVACQEGQTHIVDYLLSLPGVDVNRADRDGVTPLQLAAARGHSSVAKRLIRRGAEVNALDGLRASPLLVAAAEGHVDAARILVESGADVNLEGPLGSAPLHWAAGRGFAPVAEYLLQSGADADAADAEGMTPLHLAAVSGHADVVDLLVRGGADVERANAEGMAALHLAAMRGHCAAVKSLVMLVRSPNAGDHRGRRPLHYAAASAHTQVVQHLLLSGADLQLADCEGVLPLHLAAQSGYVDVIQFLVDTGSDVNIIDHKIQTPLHYAVMQGHEAAIQFLVETGACIVAGDWRGWSPAHVAVYHGHTKVLKYLVEKGADIDQAAASGMTVLHMATELGNQELVQYLVENGADVNAMDKQGRRPVHIAAERGLVDTASFLVAAGADTRLPNSQGGDRGADGAVAGPAAAGAGGAAVVAIDFDIDEIV